MKEISIVERRIKFEGLSIYLDNVSIEVVDEMMDDICVYSEVRQSAIFHRTTIDKTLVGDVYLTLRDQTEGSKLGILLVVKLSAKADIVHSEAHIFTLVVQYLFKFIREYLDSDDNQYLFEIPDFNYSEIDFNVTYPD